MKRRPRGRAVWPWLRFRGGVLINYFTYEVGSSRRLSSLSSRRLYGFREDLIEKESSSSFYGCFSLSHRAKLFFFFLVFASLTAYMTSPRLKLHN